ncbi:hypothetical protein [Paraburkholderia azotifigens]|uniref:hypothetical protein n=1 Tax=Paraburkholderia azotifigens TaxID=2057004 RepID=UPI00319D8E2F
MYTPQPASADPRFWLQRLTIPDLVHERDPLLCYEQASEHCVELVGVNSVHDAPHPLRSANLKEFTGTHPSEHSEYQRNLKSQKKVEMTVDDNRSRRADETSRLIQAAYAFPLRHHRLRWDPNSFQPAVNDYTGTNEMTAYNYTQMF